MKQKELLIEESFHKIWATHFGVYKKLQHPIKKENTDNSIGALYGIVDTVVSRKRFKGPQKYQEILPRFLREVNEYTKKFAKGNLDSLTAMTKLNRFIRICCSFRYVQNYITSSYANSFKYRYIVNQWTIPLIDKHFNMLNLQEDRDDYIYSRATKILDKKERKRLLYTLRRRLCNGMAFKIMSWVVPIRDLPLYYRLIYDVKRVSHKQLYELFK